MQFIGTIEELCDLAGWTRQNLSKHRKAGHVRATPRDGDLTPVLMDVVAYLRERADYADSRAAFLKALATRREMENERLKIHLAIGEAIERTFNTQREK